MKLQKTPAKIFVYILYFFALGILILLGVWQVSRGLEKKSIETLMTTKGDRVIEIRSIQNSWSENIYTQTKAVGFWAADKIFKLDNRVHQKKVGHEWLVPFRLVDDNAMILVNIGWLADEHEFNSDILIKDQVAVISGQIYQPERGFILGSAFSDNKWPRLIQYYDQEAISKSLGNNIQPVIFVLDGNDPHSLTRIWRPYVVNSTRHFGYTLQWWGIALVLVIFGFVWIRKN